MFKNKFINIIYILIVCAALLLGLKIVFQRYQYEQQNKEIQIAIPFLEVKKLSLLGAVNQNELLNQLKQIGINSIAIDEEDIEDLSDQGKITILRGCEIINAQRVGSLAFFKPYLKEIKPNYVYLIVPDPDLLKRVKTFLNADLGQKNITVLDKNLLGVADDLVNFKTIGVGFDLKQAEYLASLGFILIPRPSNSPRINPDLIALKFSYLKFIPNSNTVIFKGDTTLGYPLKLELVKKELKKQGLRVGLVEFFDQLGIKALVKKLPNQVVRVHSIPEEEMINMTFDKAVSRIKRGLKERSIRTVFLYPFLSNPENMPIIEYNLNYFSKITNYAKNKYFLSSVAERQIFPNPKLRIRTVLALSLGLFIIILFFMNFYYKINFKMGALLFILFFMGFGSCVFLNKIALWNQFFALGAAAVFPPLALIMNYAENKNNKNLLRGLFYLIKVFLIMLIGVIFVVSFLSDISFLKGAQLFSGVKLAFLFPLIFIFIYFYFPVKDLSYLISKIKRLLSASVKYGAIILGCFFLLFLLIYIIRSGNFLGGKVPSVEQESRNLLERIFGLRPRTKEFLIGYPILVFAFYYQQYLQKKGWLWFFYLLGIVGLVSLINTFCHAHSPLLVSLYRVSISLFLGYLVGLFLIFVSQIGLFFYRKFVYKYG